MPSFDIVSEVDHQSLDNAINTARKEILNRYDFNDSKTEIEFNKKELTLTLTTENSMRLKHVIDVLITRLVKQHIDPSALDQGKEEYASGNMVRKDLKIREGIDKDTARKVVKHIKDLKLKVETAIMDDKLRVTSKKIDELQEVIAAVKAKQGDWGIPLQFTNYK